MRSIDDEQRALHRRWTSRGNAMRPAHSILDSSFCYVPAVATSVAATWQRFGWRPPSEERQGVRRRPSASRVVERVDFRARASLASAARTMPRLDLRDLHYACEEPGS
jgi:hypothetical protein